MTKVEMSSGRMIATDQVAFRPPESSRRKLALAEGNGSFGSATRRNPISTADAM